MLRELSIIYSYEHSRITHTYSIKRPIVNIIRRNDVSYPQENWFETQCHMAICHGYAPHAQSSMSSSSSSSSSESSSSESSSSSGISLNINSFWYSIRNWV